VTDLFRYVQSKRTSTILERLHQNGYCMLTSLNYIHVIYACFVRKVHYIFNILDIKTSSADPAGRAVLGVDLRPLACWDCGFEPRRGYACCILGVLCAVRYRSLRRADQSYRGVLQNVLCVTE
jgi:hypothetical protein